MGFTDRYRADEVLGQLRRLEFSWVPDLEGAVAVEVDAQGRRKLRHSLVIDPAFADSAPAWRALLCAIQPSATRLQPAASDSKALNAEASWWQRALRTDSAFLRDLDAILQPGNSAILALLGDADAAVRFLQGYSGVVLRTALTEAQANKLRPSYSSQSPGPGLSRVQ